VPNVALRMVQTGEELGNYDFPGLRGRRLQTFLQSVLQLQRVLYDQSQESQRDRDHVALGALGDVLGFRGEVKVLEVRLCAQRVINVNPLLGVSPDLHQVLQVALGDILQNADVAHVVLYHLGGVEIVRFYILLVQIGPGLGQNHDDLVQIFL
jgi:hypothetical protein